MGRGRPAGVGDGRSARAKRRQKVLFSPRTNLSAAADRLVLGKVIYSDALFVVDTLDESRTRIGEESVSTPFNSDALFVKRIYFNSFAFSAMRDGAPLRVEKR